MSELINYYQKKYEQVPEWVDKMNEYNPEALKHYANLKNQILVDGALSRKNKELILVGINAARRYERSMLHHSKGALDEGATVQEFVEILSVCILSRGIPAWLEGTKAIEYALEYKPQATEKTKSDPNSVAVKDPLEYFKAENEGVLPDWVHLMNEFSPDSLARYAAIRQNELRDLVVSRKMKELVLMGINLAERYEKGVKLHSDGARKEGASEQEIAEVGLICILTAGIPAWFHASDNLR